ncbi:MAG: glucokinase [Pseudohongiellaceae bacterium]
MPSAGTGLGGAALRWIGGRPCAFAAEPGHMGLSPGSDLELAIFRELLPIHGNIYAELLVSGKGLVTLYETIAHIAGATAEPLEPAEVSKRALEGKDPHCQQALGTFCALLGSACGDFLVANGISTYMQESLRPGGILQSSEFLERMHSRADGGAPRHGQHLPPSTRDCWVAPVRGWDRWLRTWYASVGWAAGLRRELKGHAHKTPAMLPGVAGVRRSGYD